MVCEQDMLWSGRQSLDIKIMFSFHQHSLQSRACAITQQTFHIVGRFLHVEAMSGIVLFFSAIIAVVWANSSFYESYCALWYSPFITLGSCAIAWNLHFCVNDILMTLFFLIAGMEIRYEMYDGALSDFKQASLPVIAAFGGVCLPTLIYLFFNGASIHSHGWAIPTATDIAFAVGILALLGKSIPDNVRIVLLSLAIIDDVIAVLIIALFYSSGLDFAGFPVVASSVLLILVMQWFGMDSAWLYVVPAVILWFGLLKIGVHPSLAGVVLGLLTPVLPPRSEYLQFDLIMNALQTIRQQQKAGMPDVKAVTRALRDIRKGERDMIPPITRVQVALHPWVAFAVMPAFAFANAGIRFADIDFLANDSICVLAGVSLGLLAGKPLGILLSSLIAVKSGICRFPEHVSWQGMILVSILSGIGFTMATFVSMLAFNDVEYLSLAKAGVLLGSTVSAILGLIFGFFYIRTIKHTRK